MWPAAKINLSLINVNDLSQDMNLELYLYVDVFETFLIDISFVKETSE